MNNSKKVINASRLICGAVAIVWCCLCAYDLAAQDPPAIPPPPVPAPVPTPDVRLDSALRADSQERPAVVELVPGMTRNRVDALLGPPEFESLIGVTDRIKATYNNGMTLWYQNDRLSGLTGIDESFERPDGVKLGKQSLKIAPELFGPPFAAPDRSDPGYASVVRDSFLFAPSQGGPPPLDIHFTPTMPTCLTNDCPGCEACSPLGPNGDWIVTAGAGLVLMHRGSTDFTTSYDLGGATISADPLVTGLNPGLEGNLTLNVNGVDLVETRYLGLLEWSANNLSGNLATPPDSLSVRQDFEATFHDVQINHIRRLVATPWDVLWGIRYSESNDSANARIVGQFDPGTGMIPVDLSTSYRATNDLLGLQIGVQRTWACDYLLIFTGVKGAVCYNSIYQTGPQHMGSIDLQSFPMAISNFQEETDEVSFLGDFEVSVVYPVSQGFLLTCGYRGIGLSDVAQVAQQNGAPADPSSLWYNGGFVRGEVVW